LTLLDRVDQKIFNAIYSRSLVYNTCWEDPAVDRQALRLSADDTLLVITSAGCNVLDYALTGPKRIHAVDVNPRQTALLELKLAGLRNLCYEDFFALFGHGRHPQFHDIYRTLLRNELTPFAQSYWDRNEKWFMSEGNGFYYRGLSGTVARLFRAYLRLRPKLLGHVEELFESKSLESQREIYDSRIRPMMWSRGMNWTMSQQITMSLLGVRHVQRKEVQAQHRDGVAGFIRDALDYVFRELPLSSNYFYSVYVRGSYARNCCPEYLKASNFERLKALCADRIVPHTCTVTDFLRQTDEPISKFVLLDHMDWMAGYYPLSLNEEWNAILDCASPGARIIFRSAHSNPKYLEWITVGAARKYLHEVLDFHETEAKRLSLQDRVHTYAGFHIADVRI
jgi:S-adenosylmethionine-diacylglycerol 3-amino-3-carboxypropyl transferase